MRANSVLFYSLLATLVPGMATAGIRVGNLSRNNAQGYQQVNEMRYNSAANTAAAAAVNPIPVGSVPVATANAAAPNDVRAADANTADNMAKNANCSMIYPDGEFSWSRPTIGAGAGGASTCTAVVEMRAIGAGLNGSDLVVARANLAAGDSIRCNVAEFPKSTLSSLNVEITVPADSEPTIDDVIKIMNQEQKQNAGLKIAASTVIGGLGGNMAGRPEPGHDGVLGGGKAKTQGTIIGALGGAALMVGNLYTGKVAGDTILSAGVNAAAGAVVGNIVASGDSVLRIEACTVDGIDQKCLWGYYEKRTELPAGAVAYISVKNPRDFKVCYQKNPSDTNPTCEYMDLNVTNATIAGYTESEKYTDADGTEQERQVFAQSNRSTGGRIDIDTIFAQDQFKDATDKACYKYNKMQPWTSDCDDAWVKLDGTVQRVTNRTPAMVVDVKDRGMGWKKSNWRDFVSQYGGHEIVGRTGNGVASNLDNTGKPKQLSDGNFTPLYQDSEDGGIIDLSNKARLKGTLTGAGVGGGMGAFAGYQGAQQDIEERWVTAVREYKDSLQKVYCATGNRFLSHYNDTVIIPHMNDK